MKLTIPNGSTGDITVEDVGSHGDGAARCISLRISVGGIPSTLLMVSGDGTVLRVDNINPSTG